MKRITLIIISLLLLSLLSGCGERNIVYQDGAHEREEGYMAAFKTKYHEFDEYSLHIKDSIFEKEMAENISEQIDADYKVLQKFGKEAVRPVTVYVVSDTSNGRPQAVNQQIFCTPEDIESKEYRECFLQAALGVEAYWECVGLTQYLYEPSSLKNIDTEELKKYYDKEENMQTLSLNPAYFVEEFSDAETRKTAQNTAAALVSHIIKESGIQGFLRTEDLKKARQEWLASVGVSNQLEQLNVMADAMGTVFSKDYPLIVTYDNYKFYFEPTDWLVDADGVYEFLDNMQIGCDRMKVELKESEPEAYEMIEKNMSLPISIEFKNSDENVGRSTTLGQKIVLTYANSLCHEVVHVWAPSSSEVTLWANEGIAEVISGLSGNGLASYERKKFFFDWMTEKQVSGQTSDEQIPEKEREFFHYLKEYYRKDGLPLNNAESFDVAKIEELMGVVSLLHPETGIPVRADKSLLEVAGGHESQRARDIQNPNDMTYPEVTVFVRYLSEIYGLDKVISVERGVPFEEAFGVDYQTALGDCIRELENHYEKQGKRN